MLAKLPRTDLTILHAVKSAYYATVVAYGRVLLTSVAVVFALSQQQNYLINQSVEIFATMQDT